MSGSRTAGLIAEYVDKEGLHAPPFQQPTNTFNGFNNPEQQLPGPTERDLNPLVQKALVGLSFPPATELQNELLSGLGRGLRARQWIDSGGSMLLVWPRKTEAVVQFEPKPGRYTSVTLLRFFQGPP